MRWFPAKIEIDQLMPPKSFWVAVSPRGMAFGTFPSEAVAQAECDRQNAVWIDLNPPPEGWTINGVPPDPQPIIAEEKP